MEFDKDTIVNYLREQGRNDDADRAQQQLPQKVDHEEHKQLLDQFGIDPQQLISKASGFFQR
jgi:hypothetical protein